MWEFRLNYENINISSLFFLRYHFLPYHSTHLQTPHDGCSQTPKQNCISCSVKLIQDIVEFTGVILHRKCLECDIYHSRLSILHPLNSAVVHYDGDIEQCAPFAIRYSLFILDPFLLILQYHVLYVVPGFCMNFHSLRPL